MARSGLQSPRLTRDEATAAVTAVTLILGSSLFYFRLRMRSVYGLTEAMIGVSIAAYRFAVDARAVTDPNFYIAMLTAGVYLVVRGFDNVHQGLTKDPKDPVASRVASFVSAVIPLKGKVSIMGTTRTARERSAIGRIVTPRLRDAIFRASPELPSGESEAARDPNGHTGSQKLD